MQLLLEIKSIVVTIALFWLIFGIYSFLLPKPENKTENLKNFRCAHPPAIVNKEAKCELLYPFIGLFISQPVMLGIIYLTTYIPADAFPYQIFDQQIKGMPFWVQVFLGLLVTDFALWIRHGFVHKFLWPFHAVHHSAKEIGWMTTHRLHPMDQIVMGLIDLAVLYVIGFTAEGMATALLIRNMNNMFVHSNIVLDYPKPLKYLIVSPNMHRWHHATEKEAHDKNFCVVFAFIDYLFGTYYVPDNALPKAYGSDHVEMDDIERKNILQELWVPFKWWWQDSLLRKAVRAAKAPETQAERSSLGAQHNASLPPLTDPSRP